MANLSTSIESVVVHQSLSPQVEYVRQGTVYQASQVDVGLIRPEDRYRADGQLPQSEEFRISEGQPLALDLVLMSGEDSVFLITALLDYQQISFNFDGQAGLLHQIDIQGGRDLFIPISIDVQGAGAHDLAFVVFKDPYLRPKEQNSRNGGQCLLGGKRAVVVVAENDTPVRTFQPDLLGNAPPAGVTWGTPFLFASLGELHPSQPEGQMPLIQQGQAGQEFFYRVWMSTVGDTQARSLDYGLVKFLNYRQVDFLGRNMLSIHLESQQEILFNDRVPLPNQSGMSEFQIVYVMSPYKSVLRQEVATPFVYASDCLGIEVR